MRRKLVSSYVNFAFLITQKSPPIEEFPEVFYQVTIADSHILIYVCEPQPDGGMMCDLSKKIRIDVNTKQFYVFTSQLPEWKPLKELPDQLKRIFGKYPVYFDVKTYQTAAHSF